MRFFAVIAVILLRPYLARDRLTHCKHWRSIASKSAVWTPQKNINRERAFSAKFGLRRPVSRDCVRHHTRVARLAREAGVGRFIHVSGIGSDAGSTSSYIRSRGKGEKAVREAFSATTLIRPSVMFGKGDAFLIPIGRMLRRLPIFPLFGRGQTQLQPAYVEDVADAITRVMQNAQSPMCYELGGPRVYTYRSLLEVIARCLGKRPLLVPMPYGVWHALASVAEMLPEPPITRNQVELMQLDNVASPDAPGFGDLRISSTSLEDALPAIVGLSGGLSSVPPVP